MMGDFNIAPTDLDVFDPDLWREKILCSSIERKQFSEFEDLFLADSFRLKNKKPNQYSWWDYRQGSFRKNEGLRIDHILLSKPLVSMCQTWVYPPMYVNTKNLPIMLLSGLI